MGAKVFDTPENPLSIRSPRDIDISYLKHIRPDCDRRRDSDLLSYGARREKETRAYISDRERFFLYAGIRESRVTALRGE